MSSMSDVWQARQSHHSTENHCGHLLSLFSCPQRPCLQVTSHSEVPGGYEFAGTLFTPRQKLLLQSRVQGPCRRAQISGSVLTPCWVLLGRHLELERLMAREDLFLKKWLSQGHHSFLSNYSFLATLVQGKCKIAWVLSLPLRSARSPPAVRLGGAQPV